MTNTETTITNEAANNAGQGATVAPEKAPSNKGASHQKGAPKGNQGIKGKVQHTTPFDEPQAAANTRGGSQEQRATKEPKLVASAGAQVANVAPRAAQAINKATRTKKAPAANRQPKAIRKGSQTDTFLQLLTRRGGASLQGLMEATGWQAHSVRGFVSGTLGKKMGLTVISAKGKNGERRYSIAS